MPLSFLCALNGLDHCGNGSVLLQPALALQSPPRKVAEGQPQHRTLTFVQFKTCTLTRSSPVGQHVCPANLDGIDQQIKLGARKKF